MALFSSTLTMFATAMCVFGVGDGEVEEDVDSMFTYYPSCQVSGQKFETLMTSSSRLDKFRA